MYLSNYLKSINNIKFTNKIMYINNNNIKYINKILKYIKKISNIIK